MKKREAAIQELLKDLLLIFFGVIMAVYLSQNGVFERFISILGSDIVASFIAGFFFTSVLTVAPASVVLADISQSAPLYIVALFGGLGSMIGDLVIFLYLRDRFTDDVKKILRPSVVKHIVNLFHFGFLKWLSPVVGVIIIASPLPNEFGLSLLGLSKIKVALLLPLTFMLNIVAILGIVWVASNV